MELLNPLYHFSKRFTILSAFRSIAVARESNKTDLGCLSKQAGALPALMRPTHHYKQVLIEGVQNSLRSV